MGNLRDFHMLGRRIGINRQWFLLRSSIWMRYPEDQSQGLRGMRFGIIKRRSFTSVLESRNLAPRFHYHVVGKIWTLIWISLKFSLRFERFHNQITRGFSFNDIRFSQGVLIEGWIYIRIRSFALVTISDFHIFLYEFLTSFFLSLFLVLVIMTQGHLIGNVGNGKSGEGNRKRLKIYVSGGTRR